VITDATDYFPFGAPNRSVSSTAGYRYGFNGKELDKSNEFGTSNVYDYGFRIYNPSIGRFLSVDPLAKDYAWYTPYQFAGNTPIQAIDLDATNWHGLRARHKRFNV
jgi:RHS repeat-associated protein